MPRMATMKRRVVYLSDEEWQELTDDARKWKTTISGAIRTHIAGHRADNEITVGRFNTRPFTPVPKKGG